MKDLGTLSYFLGLEVVSSSFGLFLSQSKYASDLLVKGGMVDCKPSSSPASVKPGISEYDSPFLDVQLYRTLVGSLQYLTLTRPEISHLVNVACQHMHAPKLSHFVAVKRILRYVKGSVNQGLHFVLGPLNLTAFADADWAGDPVDRRSTTALGQAGFHTFRDDDGIENGEDIKSELDRAIRESRISIIIFSKNYAASTWCLEELVMILKLRTSGHVVLRVLYDVDPSEVGKQTGSFEESFTRHKEKLK
ncbi:uncharacterized mitochondrial protein AtMg00810-like [Rhododendron vialii]|uniref:uncharacterized mitochondrial protein AtMg00810-like n=1 Tax=Rhododendron vialii TaxID=182163 RepID=UPI00265DFB4C|nr:uncharacterized mitochondrial protein AtMg00810-like [Rhododendron vialii]